MEFPATLRIIEIVRVFRVRCIFHAFGQQYSFINAFRDNGQSYRSGSSLNQLLPLCPVRTVWSDAVIRSIPVIVLSRW